MLHAFLWCPSVNSFKFHTCVHTTPGGEYLRHFCSKRVPKACLTPKKCPTDRPQSQQRAKRAPASLVLTSHQMSAKLRKSSANMTNMKARCKKVLETLQTGENTEAFYKPKFAGWGHWINAIEIPSFDVINGTTRVSDPLWTPNLRSSL